MVHRPDFQKKSMRRSKRANKTRMQKNREWGGKKKQPTKQVDEGEDANE